jgi:hypothetical protein
MMSLSILCHHGGTVHPEMEVRLPYYLSQKPLWSKIYDSDVLDGGMYQARELSYFFDYIDCKFIALCVALGHPHFLSVTHYVFLLLICLELWRFGVEDLKLARWICLGALLLFWTSPAVFLGGELFRTSKIGAALTIVVSYRLLYRHLRADGPEAPGVLSFRSYLVLFGWAWLATLFDRQGVFMVGLVLVFLGFHFFSYRRRNTLRLAGPYVAALLLSLLYNYVIAPALTLAINHYRPDFTYQHLPWAQLYLSAEFFVSGAFSLYFDTVRFLLGNIPFWCAVAVVPGLIFAVLPRGAERRSHKPFFRAALGFCLSQTMLIWILILLMLLRHKPLVWPAVRRTYYFLPLVSMFAITGFWALSWFQARRRLPQRWLAVGLGAAILGNASALPLHSAIVKTPELVAPYPCAPALFEALRRMHDPRYSAPPSIAAEPVYLFFSEGRVTIPPLLRQREGDRLSSN